MFQTVISCVLEGLKGSLCEIECSVMPGFPCFHVLGLSANSANASHEKLLASHKASGFALPAERITLNVRPPQSNSVSLELAMAAGLLAAQKLIPAAVFSDSAFVGELSLDGTLLPLESCYHYCLCARDSALKRIFVPFSSLRDLEPMDNLEIIGIPSIKDLVGYLRGSVDTRAALLQKENDALCESLAPPLGILDLCQIEGQEDAKRALIIAAAGFHNLLLIGPPGVGKSMLASASIALLPEPSRQEYREIKSLHVLAKQASPSWRPYRAPHHTIPSTSLLGGGIPLKPGEVSLAHKGILFLDEIAEYPRATLEALRLPLENHNIAIDRLKEHAEFPADFMLIAGMNPCPCGYFPDSKRCQCSSQQVSTYQKRFSGPLADRMDLFVSLNAPTSTGVTITTLEAKNFIEVAIQRARLRQGDIPNSRIAPEDFERFCPMSPEAKSHLETAFLALKLSMRGYHRLIRVSRTIADLEGHNIIEENDVLEAIHYCDRSWIV